MANDGYKLPEPSFQKPPGRCTKLADIPDWLREDFEKGECPGDEPPGLTELYYQRWKQLGGKVIPPKPVTADDL